VKEKFGLTVSQVKLATDVLAGVFPDRLGCHPDELYTAAGALRAAAMVCELASALHEKEGREVLLKTACQKLYLPTAKQDAVGTGGTQELVAKMFGPAHVDLVDPISSRRDAWEPKLVATKGERNEPECCNGCINSHATCVHSPENDGECVGRETEQEWRDVREDLTALGEEPKGDEQPEICSECGRQYSTCGYQPEYQECDGFEKK
jgi:hypothetical protein